MCTTECALAKLAINFKTDVQNGFPEEENLWPSSSAACPCDVFYASFSNVSSFISQDLFILLVSFPFRCLPISLWHFLSVSQSKWMFWIIPPAKSDENSPIAIFTTCFCFTLLNLQAVRNVLQDQRSWSDHSDLVGPKILPFMVKTMYFQSSGRTKNCQIEVLFKWSDQSCTPFAPPPPPPPVLWTRALCYSTLDAVVVHF